jgi:hypothetical protein
MYCNCTVKHPLKNDANKNVFTVCAKSKGGCGKEIVSIDRIEYRYEWTPPKLSSSLSVTGGGGSGGTGYSNNDKEICPDCNGDGYVTSLIQKFNYVHSCENCNGYGRIKTHGN